MKSVPLATLSCVLWYSMPYFFIAATSVIFLIRAADIETYEKPPFLRLPLIGYVTAANATSLINTKLYHPCLSLYF